MSAAEQLAMLPCAPGLRPFWRYYGGKWRAAPLYPQPQHRTVVEPFAGSAGYSLRYADLDVVLVEKFPPVAEIWRWLIGASAEEVLEVPLADRVEDIPTWVPDGARELIRFLFNDGSATGKSAISSFVTFMRARGCDSYSWSESARARVASQVPRIKHWRIIEGDYTEAPRVRATWFVDPPYNNSAGSRYPCGPKRIDYAALGEWCRGLDGQVVVCENEGATWLPFRRFGQFRRSLNGAGSREVIWTNGWMFDQGGDR